MPLARIITEHAEEALELAIQLRSRGFEVETVAPTEVPETPADLEVQLDACDRNDVLARVLGTSPDEDLHIFVAPGALDASYSAPSSVFVPPPYKRPRVESAPKLVELALPATAANPENPKGNLWRAPEIVREATHAEPQPEAPVRTRLQIEEVAVEPVPAESVKAEPVKAEFAQAEPVQAESVQAESVRAELVQADLVPAEPVQIAGQLASEVHAAPEAHPLKAATTSAPLTVFESPEAPARATDPREVALASVPPVFPAVVTASSRRPADPLFWRIAIAAAALAASVVVVGSAWQQKHPAAGTLPSAGAQQIPFQNAPVQKSPPAPASSAKPSAPSPVVAAPPAAIAASPGASYSSASSTPAQPVAPAQPHPVAASPEAVSPPAVSSPPSPAPRPVEAKKAPVKKKPAQAQHHAANHSGDSGLIAKDTVVYYNRKGPAASSNPSPKP